MAWALVAQAALPVVNASSRARAAAARGAQATETVTVFGPERFTRQPGQPVTVTRQFSLPQGAVAPFKMQLQNGDTAGSNRVSSAAVKLNGVELLDQTDFNQNVAAINRDVTLAANNTLEVRITSAPGSHLTITFKATRAADAPPPALESVGTARAVQGQTLQVSLQGRNTNWAQGQTRASFGGEVSVGGAAEGTPGLVTVTGPTTAVADVTVSPTAALTPRTVSVTTPTQTAGQSETVSLASAFTVGAATAPGAATNVVTTIAGAAGAADFADGVGQAARFRNLTAVAVGPDDAIYVADAGNHRVRVVREQPNQHGALETLVSTLAGDGTAGFADGPGAAARFNNPQGVAVDASGAVIVADTDNHRVRRIAPDGNVTTVAGDGTPGFQNGAGAQARFSSPRGVAVDAHGLIYVADTGNAAVRVISPAGEVRTAAGDGTVGSGDSPAARFDGLAGVAADGERIYVYLADTGNHRIRRLDASDTVITIAGAERGFADGAAAQARFAEPSGIAVDGAGKLVVADAVNSLVRQINPELAAGGSPLAVTTLAGTGERSAGDGAGNQASFYLPRGVAVSKSSAVVVADTGNHTLRRILLPPAVNSITPSSARPLATVTVSGERFDARAPERNTVRFTRSAAAGGGETVAQVTAATRSTLTVVVPADVATGPVTVQTDGGLSNPVDFELAPPPAPSISGFDPKRGPVGATVTLTGAALRADTGLPEVTFGGAAGARVPAFVSLASETQVRVTVPTGAATGLIRLTNAWGAASTAEPFTVEAQQDFQLTVAPSTATAVQRASATYVVSVTSAQPNFTQLARLTASGLPEGVRVTFEPEQLAAGATSTLSLNLANVNLSPGSYPFTISAAADIEAREVVRTAAATLNVVAAGRTTLSGRVLNTDSEPIIGAIVSLDGRTATTDPSGSFMIFDITAGANRPLTIDGRTASSPNRSYPLITEPANVVAGQANVVPYIFYLPPIDVQYEVEVIPGQNTVAGNPRVPGLRMTIPAGARLRNRDESPVARVSITPLAIDRTPTPLPSNVATALVYTSQPGGALTDIPVPVVYPNLMGTEPGTRVDLYAFNHDTVRWYVYGTGTVSADGRTIAPDIDPQTGRPYGLIDFSWHFPDASPDGDPSPPDSCPKSQTDDPVDLATGMKLEDATDISFGGARGGLQLKRIYTSDLANTCDFCPFGRGTTHNYDIRLRGSFTAGGAGRLVSPGQKTGELYSFARTDTDGSLVFATTATVGQLGDVIRRLTNGTLEHRAAGGGVMRFDSAGRLTAVVDHNGNTTALSYTGGNLTRLTDPVGRSIALDYDSAGRITRATDPLDRVWRYTYEGTPGVAGGPGLTTVADPAGGVTRYTYVTGGRLASVTDPRGNTVKQITYDGSGRVREQRYADGGVERYDYTLSGRLVTETVYTDTLGRKQSQRYSAAGYVVETTDKVGQRSRIERDLATNVPTQTKGPCGCAETTRQYDARGNILSSSDSLGQTSQMEYEPTFNRLTRITDKLGRTLSFTYDARGNLLTATNALNQTTTNVYDEHGQLLSVTDALNRTRRYEYDAQGNVTAQIDAVGSRRTFEYDGVGRLVAQADPLGRRSTTTYDALDRVVAAADTGGATTRYVYDANGNQLEATDALGHKQKNVYDSKDRVVSITDALGRTSRVQYNSNDEVVRTTSPSGRRAHFTYDERGELATVKDPLGGTVVYKSDSRGNLLSLTDPRGNTTTFTYDELSRLTGTRDPFGRTSSTKYDSIGNMVEVVDRLGQRTTITYDAGNRPTRVAYADAVVGYTYDAASRVTRIDDSQSGSVEWTYDAADRFLTETTPGGTVSYAYDAAGAHTSMTAADQPPVTYGYDAAGRLQTITQGGESFTYGYDLLSRLVSLQRPNGVQTSYSYDDLNRLLRLTHAAGAGQTVEDYRFSYGGDDEIVGIESLASAPLLPAEKTADAADAANKVARVGDANFLFDDSGTTVSRTDPQGTTGYEWDARGRLTRATLPDGRSVAYGYDAVGRLASRAAAGTTTSFLYNGGDVVLDRASDGGQVSYVNGLGIDTKLRQSSAAAGALYYLTNHLGSTVALTNQTGAVVERQQYEPFGASTGSAHTRYGFTGRELEPLTGLMYYRARWYDPRQGRFISEDPAGFVGGLNKYAYVSNNPVSKTDPLGLYEEDVHYYLTLYLARQSGCFTPEQQRQIAEGAQRQDEGEPFEPELGGTEAQREVNERYHALTDPANHEGNLSRLWIEATRGHHNNPQERLTNFGRYIHYLQDTYSHQGFTNSVYGHALPPHLHRPDKTNANVRRTLDMARRTWDAMMEYGKETKCKCTGNWDRDISLQRLIDFARASGGHRGRSINNRELERKRRILRVPRRGQ